MVVIIPTKEAKPILRIAGCTAKRSEAMQSTKIVADMVIAVLW